MKYIVLALMALSLGSCTKNSDYPEYDWACTDTQVTHPLDSTALSSGGYIWAANDTTTDTVTWYNMSLIDQGNSVVASDAQIDTTYTNGSHTLSQGDYYTTYSYSCVKE